MGSARRNRALSENLETADAANGRSRRWWTDHLGTAITVGYLGLVAVGMLHTFFRYRRFGINVLDFADPSDFLLAPIRDPLVIAATVIPGALIGWLIEVITRVGTAARKRRRAAGIPIAWWETKEKNLPRLGRMNRVLQLTAMTLWVIAGSLRYQQINADRMMAGEGTRISAVLANGDTVEGSSRRPVMLIGATSRYVFLFRTEDWRTVIVPIDNVQRLTPEQQARGVSTVRPGFLRHMDSTASDGGR